MNVSKIVADLEKQRTAALEENMRRLVAAGWELDELEFRSCQDRPGYEELWGRGVCLLSSEFIFEDTKVTYRITPYPFGRPYPYDGCSECEDHLECDGAAEEHCPRATAQKEDEDEP